MDSQSRKRQAEAVDAYVALGANLADRASNIHRAVQLLGQTGGIEITRESTLVEYPAIGGPPNSPDFLNGVVAIRTSLTARELLDRLLEIERSLGRTRGQKWAPRTIDLDLLLYGNEVIASSRLAVPHPRMHERRFVLEPLAQIAPDVVHPVLQLSVGQLLHQLSTTKS